MTHLKRQASQELPPTRAPKLARGQDSVLSLLGEGLTIFTKFATTNISAFYEGTRLVRLTLAYVTRFRCSCH